MQELVTLAWASPYRFAPHPRHVHPPLSPGRWCIVYTDTPLARASGCYKSGCGATRSYPHSDLRLVAELRRICWRCTRGWSRRYHNFPLPPVVVAYIRAETRDQATGRQGHTHI